MAVKGEEVREVEATGHEQNALKTSTHMKGGVHRGADLHWIYILLYMYSKYVRGHREESCTGLMYDMQNISYSRVFRLSEKVYRTAEYSSYTTIYRYMSRTFCTVE
jgi:hypothetical protein